MPPRRDPEKEARLAKYVKRTLDWEFRKAAIHRDKIRSGVEGDKRWDERTVRDVWSLKVMELEAAAKRAQQGQQQINLGVVVVPAQMESVDDWERMGKSIRGADKALAIEAVVEKGGDE